MVNKLKTNKLKVYFCGYICLRICHVLYISEKDFIFFHCSYNIDHGFDVNDSYSLREHSFSYFLLFWFGVVLHVAQCLLLALPSWSLLFGIRISYGVLGMNLCQLHTRQVPYLLSNLCFFIFYFLSMNACWTCQKHSAHIFYLYINKIMWILCFILLIWYTTFFNFYKLNHIYIYEINLTYYIFL